MALARGDDAQDQGQRRTAAGARRSSRARRRRRGSRRSASRSRAVPPATCRRRRTTTSSRGAEQPLERRLEPERVAQLLVGAPRLRACRLALDRADEHVLRRVLERRRTRRAACGSPASSSSCARSASVTSAANRSFARPCRRSGASRSLSICRYASFWQHGTARIASACQRTACASASSVAVSQACRLTTRSTCPPALEARDVAVLEAKAARVRALSERRAGGDHVRPSGRGRRSRPRGPRSSVSR